MRPLGWVPVILIATSACSSGGPSAGPEPPVSWTPGRYTLEATIPSADGSDQLTADLRIGVAGTMTLRSSSGNCLEPTPAALRRDEQNRRRTFSCGDATYVIRPASGRVRGEVRALVTELVRQQVPCVLGRVGPCYRMSTRRVRRSANLIVLRIN